MSNFQVSALHNELAQISAERAQLFFDSVIEKYTCKSLKMQAPQVELSDIYPQNDLIGTTCDYLAEHGDSDNDYVPFSPKQLKRYKKLKQFKQKKHKTIENNIRCSVAKRALLDLHSTEQISENELECIPVAELLTLPEKVNSNHKNSDAKLGTCSKNNSSDEVKFCAMAKNNSCSTVGGIKKLLFNQKANENLLFRTHLNAIQDNAIEETITEDNNTSCKSQRREADSCAGTSKNGLIAKRGKRWPRKQNELQMLLNDNYIKEFMEVDLHNNTDPLLTHTNYPKTRSQSLLYLQNRQMKKSFVKLGTPSNPTQCTPTKSKVWAQRVDLQRVPSCKSQQEAIDSSCAATSQDGSMIKRERRRPRKSKEPLTDSPFNSNNAQVSLHMDEACNNLEKQDQNSKSTPTALHHCEIKKAHTQQSFTTLPKAIEGTPIKEDNSSYKSQSRGMNSCRATSQNGSMIKRGRRRYRKSEELQMLPTDSPFDSNNAQVSSHMVETCKSLCSANNVKLQDQKGTSLSSLLLPKETKNPHVEQSLGTPYNALQGSFTKSKAPSSMTRKAAVEMCAGIPQDEQLPKRGLRRPKINKDRCQSPDTLFKELMEVDSQSSTTQVSLHVGKTCNSLCNNNNLEIHNQEDSSTSSALQYGRKIKPVCSQDTLGFHRNLIRDKIRVNNDLSVSSSCENNLNSLQAEHVPQSSGDDEAYVSGGSEVSFAVDDVPFTIPRLFGKQLDSSIQVSNNFTEKGEYLPNLMKVLEITKDMLTQHRFSGSICEKLRSVRFPSNVSGIFVCLDDGSHGFFDSLDECKAALARANRSYENLQCVYLNPEPRVIHTTKQFVCSAVAVPPARLSSIAEESFVGHKSNSDPERLMETRRIVDDTRETESKNDESMISTYEMPKLNRELSITLVKCDVTNSLNESHKKVESIQSVVKVPDSSMNIASKSPEPIQPRCNEADECAATLSRSSSCGIDQTSVPVSVEVPSVNNIEDRVVHATFDDQRASQNIKSDIKLNNQTTGVPQISPASNTHHGKRKLRNQVQCSYISESANTANPTPLTPSISNQVGFVQQPNQDYELSLWKNDQNNQDLPQVPRRSGRRLRNNKVPTRQFVGNSPNATKSGGRPMTRQTELGGEQKTPLKKQSRLRKKATCVASTEETPYEFLGTSLRSGENHKNKESPVLEEIPRAGPENCIVSDSETPLIDSAGANVETLSERPKACEQPDLCWLNYVDEQSDFRLHTEPVIGETDIESHHQSKNYRSKDESDTTTETVHTKRLSFGFYDSDDSSEDEIIQDWLCRPVVPEASALCGLSQPQLDFDVYDPFMSKRMIESMFCDES
ncbi:uncharacterized protein LOC108666583 [Hyalella azteca]|uniref:Uncharacterized protein LOC108666583 n=1 Tax=Hyalella azteca TaxID=294128 RepID=A0A8B7N5V4_HYAAZ|nr:uncharacterized protein LOC108666583 [Hyalella azteca]